jgi:Protein of unknown function (DUF983)
MRVSCPECGYGFEREEGYWVGAIIINTAVTEALFGLLFVLVILLTLPDIRWGPLLAVALVTNGLFPWLFYPFSKTLWMAVDLYLHPPPESGDPARRPGP